MRKKYLLICLVGVATVLLPENFLVKKTKQIVVNYDDQWCDLFGKLMQLLADFDMQKSRLQKKGIQEIMCAFENGEDIALAQLPKSQQQEAVAELQKLIDQVHKTTVACELYTKKLETLLADDKKSKK